MVTLIAALVVGLVMLPVYGLWWRRVDRVRVPIAALSGVVLLLTTTVAADIRIRDKIAERRAAIERLCSLPVADKDDAAWSPPERMRPGSARELNLPWGCNPRASGGERPLIGKRA